MNFKEKKAFDFKQESGYCGYKELYGLLYLLYSLLLSGANIVGIVDDIIPNTRENPHLIKVEVIVGIADDMIPCGRNIRFL
jgi:hypothetical protein